jgi:DNA primase
MQQHVDTAAIRRDFPIADVVARYGIDLRPNGRSLVGRCPFHADGGRPNLHIYPATCSFYCYRCAIGGDVISFVERIEGVGFRRAVERLTGQPTVASITRSQPARRRVPIRAPTFPGADERACLAAAVELYQSQLHKTCAGDGCLSPPHYEWGYSAQTAASTLLGASSSRRSGADNRSGSLAG